jgi:hypothetical protein
MISPGFETTDPITQTRLVVVKGAQETAGCGWVTEIHCPEGAAPLQAAATIRTLTKHGGFDAAVPIALQLGLSATLGRLAEARGYRAVYDRYVS